MWCLMFIGDTVRGKLLSDLAKYTTFKVRRELGDIVDLLIEKYIDRLGVLGMDSRSGFVSYVFLELAKHEGLIDEIDPALKRFYSGLF